MPGLNGLVVMKPTSVASTGSGNSASIGADGKVTFSACTSLSLNGVFTSSYSNYMLSVRFVYAANTDYLCYRLRSSGTDAAGADYTFQSLSVDGTSVAAGRQAANTVGPFAYGSTQLRSGATLYLFGPQLAQVTAARSAPVSGYLGGYIVDYTTIHNQANSYDGITLLDLSGALYSKTGAVTVYGFNQ